MGIFNFFKKGSDKIDKKKVAANLFVLGHGSYELAELFASFDEEQKELLRFATKSIRKIDPIGGLPIGFPSGFVATYPDVVLWWSSLSDEKQEELFKDLDTNNFFDDDKKIKQKYLMKVVYAYKNAGFRLECICSEN